MPVSAADCIQPAIQHAKDQLFTRFRWGQWSRLALVAILAAELHVGGCGFGNIGRHWSRTPRRNPAGLLPSSAISFGGPPFSHGHLSEHIGLLVGLILAAMLAAIVLTTVFLYLNSVFRFILFDSVLRRYCSIGDGWQRWRRAGGRFFLWQIVFQIAAWLFLGLLIGLPLAIALTSGWMTNLWTSGLGTPNLGTSDLHQHIGGLIVGAVVLVGLFAIFVLTAVTIQVLAKDFLVPIMALEDLDFADGWHRLLAIIGREKGPFAIYLLLKLVLSIAAAIVFTIIALIPGLFVFVPAALVVIAAHSAGLGWTVITVSMAIIFGALLLLVFLYVVALVSVPATVFFPAYAMYFLAARYPNLDALLHPAPASPAPELPPVPHSPPPSVEPV